MYVIVCTPSNIGYVMSVVSKFMSNLGWAHWQALKWILHYLKGSLVRVLVGEAIRSIRDSPIERFVCRNGGLKQEGD